MIFNENRLRRNRSLKIGFKTFIIDETNFRIRIYCFNYSVNEFFIDAIRA